MELVKLRSRLFKSRRVGWKVESSKYTNISDGAESPNGSPSIRVLLPGHVLGEAGGDDDDVL